MSRIRPRTADDLTPAELATAAIDVDRVLARPSRRFGPRSTSSPAAP